VAFRGALADVEVPADLPIGEALLHESGDLELPRCDVGVPDGGACPLLGAVGMLSEIGVAAGAGPLPQCLGALERSHRSGDVAASLGQTAPRVEGIGE
jgi:hypothetical protein